MISGERGLNVDSQAEARRSAAEDVRDRLRQAILDGGYPAGTQLRQEELAERFGTSRIPVREAFRQLEAEGLIKLLPNKGATVAALSWSDVNELLEIRIGLECRALRLAIPNMIQADFEQAAEILATYDSEISPVLWSQMNWRFHETLYLPCNLPRLIALIEGNYGQLSLYDRTQVSKASGKDIPQQEHFAILDACRRGAADEAVKLLEQHIVHTQKSLMAAARRKRSA
nr:GntR family transcriptional regulator [Bosea sp. F3-2]